MPKTNVSNTTIIAGVVIILLFFYVYQRIQIFRLGYKIRNIEKQSFAFEEDNSFLNLKISGLISPEHIAKEIKRLGLELVSPKGKQIIRVK